MNYQDYSTEDFVLDQNFRKWVLGEDPEANEFWAQWISQNPDQLQTIKEARQLILNIGELKYEIQENKVDQIWRTVKNHIDKSPAKENDGAKMVSISPEAVIYSSERQLNRKRNNSFAYLWRVAAVFILGLGISFYFLKDEFKTSQGPAVPKQIVKSNPLGQKSTIYLNDGSEVVLNSGSTLSYDEDFGETDREISLTGEAYFKVAHDKTRPFTVRSGGIETTALGTEFNVRAYDDEPVSVALTKGKVSVVKHGENRPEDESVILTPGEGVEYTDDENLSKFNFDEKEYTSWVNGILYFHEASEGEVIRKLEKWYGVKFQIENKSPRKWGYTGEFDRKSLESVLLSMSFAMDFAFNIENDTVKLKYNTKPL